MEINYKNLSNDELLNHICEMQKELKERQKAEEEKRWNEVCNILSHWFRDYGEININDGESYLSATADYSFPGEISTSEY